MWPFVPKFKYGIRCAAAGLLWMAGSFVNNARAEGARDFVTKTWTTLDGLPHNRINQIVQDGAGFLWLATHAGLVRFDGQEFRDFPPPDTGRMLESVIRAIALEDPATLAVIPASDEVYRLRDGQFQLLGISAALAGQMPAQLFAEANGTLWVGTVEGRLYRWQSGDLQVFGPADGIDPSKPSFSFAVDEKGRTWVATGAFLARYEDRRLVRFAEPLPRLITIARARSGGVWILAGGQLRKLEQDRLTTLLSDPPWIRLAASVRHMFEDREGRLWIAATNHGIFWFQDGQLTRAPLPFNTVTAITEDREGNIWLGTKAEGLSILRRKRFDFYDNTSGLSEKLSLSVCEDASGAMWFANGSGGLVRRKAGRLEHFRVGPDGTAVSVVCPDSQGNLWVGTTNGLYRVSTEKPEAGERIAQPMSRIVSLFLARNGDLWIVGDGGIGFLRGTSFHPIELGKTGGGFATALAQDAQGTMWVGTNFGLQRYRDGKLQAVPASEGLPAVAVNCLYLDRAGSLWVGTQNGLSVRENGRFWRFTEADGLRDHIILQVLEDDTGRLWFGSSKGHFSVLRRELEAVRDGRMQRVNALFFGPDEGLSGALPVSGVQPAVWKDRAGGLWFATQQGILALDPRALADGRAAPLSGPMIDEVRIDDRATDAGGAIRVPPGRHRVEFRFVAPTFTSPGNVRFRHQLEGIDADWIETKAGQPVSYPALAPGVYRLRVVASDGNGRWSESPATREVIVMPAWWQRGEVRAAGALAALAFVSLLVRFVSQATLRRRLARLEGERALEKERARIARDVHDDLGGSLTSVRLLVSRLQSAPAAAVQSRLVEQLNRQTRQLAFDLERVVWTVHPKSRSVEQLITFIGRFARNLLQGSSIQCVIRRGAGPPPRVVSPETLHHILAVAKEAINNAVKHSQASEVVIETAYEDGDFTLTIRDNGTGFDPGADVHAERNGLGNMRTRAEEIGARITISSGAGRGTAIALRVPIPAESPPNPAS